MGVRTVVELDEELMAALKAECQSKSLSFDEVLNAVIKRGLAVKPFVIKPRSMGWNPDLNYDCIGALIEYGEGPEAR